MRRASRTLGWPTWIHCRRLLRLHAMRWHVSVVNSSNAYALPMLRGRALTGSTRWQNRGLTSKFDRSRFICRGNMGRCRVHRASPILIVTTFVRQTSIGIHQNRAWSRCTGPGWSSATRITKPRYVVTISEEIYKIQKTLCSGPLFWAGWRVKIGT